MLKNIILFVSLFSLHILAHADESDHSQLLKGSLSGETAKQAAAFFLKEFLNNQTPKQDYYSLYSRYVDQIGVNEISRILETESPFCHGEGHALGRIVGERVSDLHSGMKICGATCTYGCLHGVFKVYFSKLGKSYHEHSGHSTKQHSHENVVDENEKIIFTPEQLKKFSEDVNVACHKSDSVVDGFFQGNCAHGVGHAMGKMAPSVALANSYCKIFPELEMQYYCETGVFMELEDVIKEKLYPSSVKRSDKAKISLAFCDKESRFPSACLRFLLPHHTSLGQVTRHSYHCEKQSAHLKLHCYNALGYLSRAYIGENPKEFIYVCSQGDSESQMACLSGVGLMKKGHEHRLAIQKACRTLESEQQAKFCEQQTDHYYYQLNNAYVISLLKPAT